MVRHPSRCCKWQRILTEIHRRRTAVGTCTRSGHRPAVASGSALGEAHLLLTLQAYARYYNEIRTHQSLDKDAPVSRPVQQVGRIISRALLGGLHHQYVRI